MRALARQTSELDALDAHIANSVASVEDVGGEDGVATASVTPAKGVGTLTVKTTRDDGDDATRRRAKNAFSIALEEEIEHMHDRECCATPATTSSAVPLHAAVARGDAAAARALAPGRVDVGGGDEGEGAGASWPPSKGPLERISSYDDVQKRRREVGLDARNEHGDTALVVACALEDGESCAEMVKILVDAGADLHAVSNGYAAVHWACRFGHVEAVAYMVNASKARGETVGVEDIRAGDGSTPLLVAAEYGQMDVIRWFLANTSVNTMTRDAQGRDVLAALGSKMRRQSQSAKRDLRADMFALVPSLRLAFISHPDCEEHVSFKPHQESPERILAIFEELERVTHRGELEDDAVERLTTFDAADPHEILRAHSEQYVRVLAKLSDQVGGTPIAFTPYCQNQKGVPEKFQKPAENSDTFFSPGTLQAALRAAGGVIHAVNRVIKGENRSAFVCCRPPGHHAGVDGATDGAPSSGFSILNNAMIGTIVASAYFFDIVFLAVLRSDVARMTRTPRHAYRVMMRVPDQHSPPLTERTERGSADRYGRDMFAPPRLRPTDATDRLTTFLFVHSQARYTRSMNSSARASPSSISTCTTETARRKSPGIGSRNDARAANTVAARRPICSSRPFTSPTTARRPESTFTRARASATIW